MIAFDSAQLGSSDGAIERGSSMASGIRSHEEIARGAFVQVAKPARNSGCTVRKDVPDVSPGNSRSLFHCSGSARR